MLGRLGWGALACALAAIMGYAAVDTTALLIVVGGLAVAAAAAKPQVALLVLIPVALWPEQPTVAGSPIVYAYVAAVEAGVLLRHGARLGETRKPVLLSLGFGIAMLAAFANHGAPLGVTPEEQRNHLIAFLLGVGLVPTVALVRPPLILTLRWLAVSGAAASAYSFTFAQRAAGRVGFEQFNSDVLGCAAAIAILAALALWRIERRAVWLAVSAPGVLAFMAAQTRSALVVLVIGLLATWLLSRPGPSRVIATCFGLAALPFLIQPALALQRALFSQRDARFLEVEGRIKALELALTLVREQPLFGVGYRHFPDEATQRLGYAINAHNDFALLAAENGLPALLLFLALLARVLTFRHPDPTTQAAIRGLLIAAFAAFAFGNVLTDLRMTLPGWLLLGVAWTLPVRQRGRPPRQAQPSGPPRQTSLATRP